MFVPSLRSMCSTVADRGSVTYIKWRLPMSISFRRNAVAVCLFAAGLLPAQARAQNWSFDARAVGLGGVGSTSNVAADMVDEQRPSRAAGRPAGWLQPCPRLRR